MKTKEIKAVLRLLDGTDVTEFEYEDEGLRIVVRRGAPAGPTVVAAPFAGLTSVAGMPAVTSAVPVVDAAPAHSGHVVTSPFVGTFYRAPAPDSAPFADVGQHVTKGQTLCIVEAMKLMNEIEADVDGVVKRILVENAQPVEYDQELFVIEPG
ncbi:MAG: acetyl-CoA carboxylase biotin carboxyl carrier protein [Proteobacteria bacterium]|nr:acetyl-CoA carboxylase biotin carboxyl carrier protein [Pseudomonadota bacterium]